MSATVSPSYNLSFTAASLRPELARIVAEAYGKFGNWHHTREWVRATNALQCRGHASLKRMESELRQRLETLTKDQITLLATATSEDRAAMAWLAVCKRSRFAFEFAADILREKLANHDPVLRHSDYEQYLESRAANHPELLRLTSSSMTKIRQVLFSMLVDAGLLAEGKPLGLIRRPILSPEVVAVVRQDRPAWLAAFLVSDGEISKL